MTDLPVLRSRQASGIERRTVQGPSDALAEKAKMLAAAGAGALPKAYANNPGACLMALDWADRNDVSIFETVGHVSFVRAKPVVEVVLKKKLAARAGYRPVVVDSSPTAATVKIVGPDNQEINGEGDGRYTYRIETAEAYGLTGKDNWKADPEWMLIIRATDRALELHGPADLAPMFAEADLDPPTEGPDLLPPVEPADDLAAADETSPPNDASDAETVEAEVLPPTLNDVLEAATAKSIKPAALKAQVVAMGYEITAINQVMDNAEALTDLADWIDQQ